MRGSRETEEGREDQHLIRLIMLVLWLIIMVALFGVGEVTEKKKSGMPSGNPVSITQWPGSFV